MHRTKILLAVAMLVVAGFTLPPARLCAQAANEEIQTLTYDVSDLLRVPAKYPLPGDMPVEMVEMPAPPAQNPQQTQRKSLLDDVIQLLMDTVATETWRENGGTVGSIRALGTTLVISQTKTNQKSVATLLNQLRADPGPSTMLSVRAYWLKLDPQEFAAVLATRGAPQKNDNGVVVSPMAEVPDKFLDKEHLYFMGQTTGFNGQTVHVAASRQLSYVSDVTPIVAANVVGYDPTIGRLETGVKLQVTPQIMPTGDSAVLDMHSTVSENALAGQIAVEVATTRPSGSGAMIDRVNTVNQTFRTTVRLPLRKRILVGGMTLESGKDGATRQLFLAVEVDAVR